MSQQPEPQTEPTADEPYDMEQLLRERDEAVDKWALR